LKRIIAMVSLAAALCAALPAHAVGPLGAIVIGYLKQALKEKMVAYAKEQAGGMIGESLAGVPGASMLGLVPGMAGFAPKPTMPTEAVAALKAAGFNDVQAKPLTDAEWDEYAQTIAMMAKAADSDEEAPDINRMRMMMTSIPQMSGMLRMQLQQFREMKAEQARMREAYARMSEAERQEIVVEMAKTLQEQPVEDRPQALRILTSEVLGLPDDLKRRLLAL
jgi:uncharacterized membrane protein YeaQ/YmgE (transglycosylase-associated protein family)